MHVSMVYLWKLLGTDIFFLVFFMSFVPLNDIFTCCTFE